MQAISSSAFALCILSALALCCLNPASAATLSQQHQNDPGWFKQQAELTCKFTDIKGMVGSSDQTIEQYCRCSDGSYGNTCEQRFANPCYGNSVQFFNVPENISPRYYVHCAHGEANLFKCPAFLVWDEELLTCGIKYVRGSAGAQYDQFLSRKQVQQKYGGGTLVVPSTRAEVYSTGQQQPESEKPEGLYGKDQGKADMKYHALDDGQRLVPQMQQGSHQGQVQGIDQHFVNKGLGQRQDIDRQTVNQDLGQTINQQGGQPQMQQGSHQASMEHEKLSYGQLQSMNQNGLVINQQFNNQAQKQVQGINQKRPNLNQQEQGTYQQQEMVNDEQGMAFNRPRQEINPYLTNQQGMVNGQQVMGMNQQGMNEQFNNFQFNSQDHEQDMNNQHEMVIGQQGVSHQRPTLNRQDQGKSQEGVSFNQQGQVSKQLFNNLQDQDLNHQISGNNQMPGLNKQFSNLQSLADNQQTVEMSQQQQQEMINSQHGMGHGGQVSSQHSQGQLSQQGMGQSQQQSFKQHGHALNQILKPTMSENEIFLGQVNSERFSRDQQAFLHKVAQQQINGRQTKRPAINQQEFFQQMSNMIESNQRQVMSQQGVSLDRNGQEQGQGANQQFSRQVQGQSSHQSFGHQGQRQQLVRPQFPALATQVQNPVSAYVNDRISSIMSTATKQATRPTGVQDATIAVQRDLTMSNVLPVDPFSSKPQSLKQELNNCDLQPQLQVPVVFQVNMKSPLNSGSTQPELAKVFQFLQQQSRQGIHVLLTFPSE